MKKHVQCLFVLLSCIGLFCPAAQATESISDLTRIVCLKVDASNWYISIYNVSAAPLNGVSVQAMQSVYRPEQSGFKNDLSPASAVMVNLPAGTAVAKKMSWNKRSAAKTLQFTIVWQGSARTKCIDLTKQYACTPSDTRNPNVPVYVESISIKDSSNAAYTNKAVMVFNNPTPNLIDATISPWRRGINGDKIFLAHRYYQYRFYPDRTTEVAYHFNAIEGTEEFGVEYLLSGRPMVDVSEKVVCTGSILSRVKRPKLKTKINLLK